LHSCIEEDIITEIRRPNVGEICLVDRLVATFKASLKPVRYMIHSLGNLLKRYFMESVLDVV
jgi:hypothetical protein